MGKINLYLLPKYDLKSMREGVAVSKEGCERLDLPSGDLMGVIGNHTGSVALLESFRALKLSRLESFRALKF